MSWKLTKKLKETHLAPLANPFSRSSSTSTITPSDANTSRSSTPSNKSFDSNGIAASEANVTPPPPPFKPGTLRVTLHEGKGFSLPPDAEKLFANPPPAGTYGAQNASRAAGAAASLAQANSFAGSYGNFGRPKASNGGAGGFSNIPSNHGRYNPKFLPYALLDFDKQQIFVSAVSGSPENPLWAGDNTGYQFDVSRVSELTFELYVRNPYAPPSSGRNHDILIGRVKYTPKFEESKAPVNEVRTTNRRGQGMTYVQHDSNAGVTWVNLQYGSGSFKFGCEFVETKQKSLSIEDFELLKVVGKGSFGKVMQVRKKDTQRIYALKSLRKAHIISRSEVSHTMAERSVLAQINNPFIVPLKFSFQSPDKLYLVLAFVNGGELFHHLQKEQRFDQNRARFYAAELLCALECLHGFNVIYRDLKPENILLDYTGHITLCDFGLCKLEMRDEDTTNTFCGTPEYLAPELLQGTGYTKTVDWWTLGVLLYEMLTGLPPFYDENTNEMYRKILTEPLHFPSDKRIMPDAARDILTKLLDRRPDKRLGVNGAAEIKAHDFFDRIDWRKLLERKYEPVFKPNVADQMDTANFDREFTSEAPTDSYVEGPLLSQTMQQQFTGWSYNRPVAGVGDFSVADRKDFLEDS